MPSARCVVPFICISAYRVRGSTIQPSINGYYNRSNASKNGYPVYKKSRNLIFPSRFLFFDLVMTPKGCVGNECHGCVVNDWIIADALDWNYVRAEGPSNPFVCNDGRFSLTDWETLNPHNNTQWTAEPKFSITPTGTSRIMITLKASFGLMFCDDTRSLNIVSLCMLYLPDHVEWTTGHAIGCNEADTFDSHDTRFLPSGHYAQVTFSSRCDVK
eukprot:SAG31_NODE_4038_length_3643_cov_289.233070_2_plen_215_part_00